MELIDRAALLVVGHVVRTTNAAEMDPASARLPGLWNRAGAPGAFDRVPGRADGNLYAVLTDYESDHTGAYTQVVGVAVTSPEQLPEGLVAVAVPARRCAKWSAKGPMPQSLIEAWQAIWKQTEVTRAYATDLEVHHADGADIYLSIR